MSAVCVAGSYDGVRGFHVWDVIWTYVCEAEWMAFSPVIMELAMALA
jgi:hypothetical protein